MSGESPKTSAEAKENAKMWSAMGLVWELGFIIALPAVLFGFGGAYLDKYLGLSPLFTILGLALALLASGLTIYRRIRTLTSRL